MLQASWNTGYVVALIVFAAIVVICVIVGIRALIIYSRTDRNESNDGAGFTFIACVIIAIIAIGLGIWTGFPFAGVYHRYVPVSGIVQSNSSRFLSDGSGGTNQSFLIVIKGQPYRCDDTRCANLAKGDAVTLMCERQWIANGEPGYVCNFGKYGLNVGLKEG